MMFSPIGRDLADPVLMTGKFLQTLEVKDEKALPVAIQRAITKETRAEHRLILKTFSKLHPSLFSLPLPTAVVDHMAEQRTKFKWRPSTWKRKLGSTLGAFERLEQYTQCPSGINLQKSAVFRDAMRQANQDANRQQVNFPEPMTKGDVVKALEKENSQQTRAAIMIAWATAQRTGCILSLQKKDVKMEEREDDKTISDLTVKISKGKGAKAHQPYSVAVVLPDKWKRELERFIRRKQDEEFLFPAPTRRERLLLGTNIRVALRRVDSKYEQRSLRRGALQAMARAGTHEDVLMRISGHQRVQTLLRYLDWGDFATERHQSTRDAAKILF